MAAFVGIICWWKFVGHAVGFGRGTNAWSNLVFEHVLGYMLYINWVLLSFAALMQYGQKKLQDLSLGMTLLSGFFLLQSLCW